MDGKEGLTESVSPPEEVRQRLLSVLEELQSSLPGTVGSVLVDEDGAPLVTDLKGGADPTVVATAGAALGRSSERASELLGFGPVRSTVLTSENGSIAVFRVSARVSLVVLLQPSTNSVLAVVEFGKALERLREVIVPGF